MRYRIRLVCLGLAGIVAVGVTASGCATPWFGTAKSPPPKAASSAQPADPMGDLKQATITYINGLCKLPKEQRDALMREVNQSLLPNHATISCGRAGEP